jgi:hypothetical protein
MAAENQYFLVLQVHQVDSRFVGLTFKAGCHGVPKIRKPHKRIPTL